MAEEGGLSSEAKQAKEIVEEMLERLREELIELYGEEDARAFFRTVGLLDEEETND